MKRAPAVFAAIVLAAVAALATPSAQEAPQSTFRFEIGVARELFAGQTVSVSGMAGQRPEPRILPQILERILKTAPPGPTSRPGGISYSLRISLTSLSPST